MLRALPNSLSLILLAIVNFLFLTIFIANDQVRNVVLNQARQALGSPSDPLVAPEIPYNNTQNFPTKEWDKPVQNEEKQKCTPIDLPAAVPTIPAECTYCTERDPICKRYGEYNLARSRSYEGPSARLRRVLHNARSGKPTKIAVLGGSVSAGHGVAHEQNWVIKLFVWWQEKFPHPDNDFNNGAVPAVTSDYYSACAREHIDEDVDLIVIELAVNDGRNIYFTHAYEWFIRDMLDLPKKPAILYVHTMALSFDTISTGGDQHIGLHQHYDIPTISIRNTMLQLILDNPGLEEHYWTPFTTGGIDLRHINNNGHRVLHDLLISYIERQICAEAMNPGEYSEENLKKELAASKNNKDAILLPNRSDLFKVPKLRLLERYIQGASTPKTHPKCASTMSKKSPLVPYAMDGWYPWSWKDKSYFVSKTPGAKITFEVELAGMGIVLVSYLRSRVFGLGDLKCWLDDKAYDPKVFEGYWDDPTNVSKIGTVVVSGSPGRHLVYCEILETTHDPNGGHEFRIISVASV